MHSDDTALRRLLDEAQADAVAHERSRLRWLRQQAEEDATFTGTLSALLERGALLTLETGDGRRYQGRLLGLGQDVAALRTADGRTTWLRLETIGAVRPEPGLRVPPASDERAQVEDRTMAEVLSGLAEERPLVALRLHRSATPIEGVLRAVGSDVATVLEGDRREPCYIRLSSVSEVSLFDSG